MPDNESNSVLNFKTVMDGRLSANYTKDVSHEPRSKKQKLDNIKLAFENVNFKENKNNIFAHSDIYQNKLKTDQNKIQYLDTPLKSQDDLRKYKALKLQNGLTVLLISDEEKCSSNNLANTLDNEKTREPVGSEIVAFCSLCINVGSFSDPPYAPGLAHLLEHTISMGSKKYPKENDYHAFINQRWGCYNASTGYEDTLFNFQIREKYLLEALDRFANFFIDPLVTRDTISRECHSIDNGWYDLTHRVCLNHFACLGIQFKLEQQSDDIRRDQLIFNFKKSDHPASIFPCGNSYTLQHNIDLDKLYSELQKFRKKHYSAHRMTLVVQASLSLNILEDFIKQCFSDVPTNYLPPDDFSQYVGMDCFDSSKFKRIYYIKTMKDVLEIELNWVMPPMCNFYKSKPWFYLSEFLCRTEEGSLFRYLEKKLWGFHNNVYDTILHISTYSLFSLRLHLTDEGYRNLNEILKIIFSYINFIQLECTDQLIFDKFLEYVQASSSFDTHINNDTENIALNMQYYPSTYYLNGHDSVFQYDPKIVQYFINLLKPDNVNIIISSKQLDDVFYDREFVYKTEYFSREIPEELIKCWKTIEPLPEFYFAPKKVQTLVNNCSNNQSESITVELLKIDNDKNIDLWYKKNPTRDSSNFSMCLHLNNSSLYDSPTQTAIINMIILIFNGMTEYSCDLSSLLSCQFSFKGFLIDIPEVKKMGSLSRLSQMLLDLIFCDRLITEDMFYIAKSEMLRRFHNIFIDPTKLIREVWLSLTLSEFWMSQERYNALVDMTYSQFIDYIRNGPKKYFIQCLIEGNMEAEEIIGRVCQVVKPLLINSLSLNENYKLRILKFVNGEKCCQIKNINLSDSITVVNNFYQTDIASVKLLVICKLLTVIVNQPLFHCLRTQEQLGYHVEFSHSYLHGVLFLEVVVFTQADKFTGEYINGRIQHFINNYAETLKNMSKEEFDLYKENYIKYSHHNPVPNDELLCLKTEVLGEPLPMICEKEMKTLESVTLEEVYSSYVNYMTGESGFKKISLQVVGTPDSSYSIDESINTYKDGKYLLRYSTEIKENEKINSDYYIGDINMYKSYLSAY